MTGNERAAELELLRGPQEIPPHHFRERVEELVGHQVALYQLVHRAGWDRLVEEARQPRQNPLKEIFRRGKAAR